MTEEVKNKKLEPTDVQSENLKTAEDQDVDTQDEVKAEPAAEATPVEIPETIQQHVTPSGDHVDHAEAHIELEETGATLSAEHHPVNINGSEVITNLDEPFRSPDAVALRKNPDEASLAHNASEKRISRIEQFRRLIAGKLFAGRKIPEQPAFSTPEDVAQFPSAPSSPDSVQEVKKAA